MLKQNIPITKSFNKIEKVILMRQMEYIVVRPIILFCVRDFR